MNGSLLENLLNQSDSENLPTKNKMQEYVIHSDQLAHGSAQTCLSTTQPP